MSDNRGIEIVHQFFPGTGRTYDLIVNLCTFGFDRWWKGRIGNRIPADARLIMDQACGTGILTFKIARQWPGAHIVGVDVTEEYLVIAKEKAAIQGVKNVEFLLGRAEEVLLGQSFDCITSSYLAKYAELEVLIENIQTMLRPGGTLIMHDFTYPPNRAMTLLWLFYFRLLQTIGARKFPEWKAAFDGLPGLLRNTAWVSELVTILQKHHFSGIDVQSLAFGTAAIVTAQKDKPPG